MGHRHRQTLAAEFSLSGIGLHSGVEAQVRVLPAPSGQGRYFVRVDWPGLPVIPARIEAVCQTQLSTELGLGKATVRTVEHLLAALMGMGVDDARIEVSGPEVPLLDGSAQPWVEAIARVGVRMHTPSDDQQGSSTVQDIVRLAQPLWVQHEDAFVAALPASEIRFTYGINFAVAAIGQQWYSWSPLENNFATEVAPARTFGLLTQIESLRAQRLINGGNLENALVCSPEGWLNPPLRFSNEPARHKLLDLVGDLSLLETIPCMHIIAYKASHRLHIQLAQQLAKHLTPQA